MAVSRGPAGWLCPRGLMTPGEFRAVEQCPVEVLQPLTPLRAPHAGQPLLEVSGLLRSRPPRQHGQVGRLDGGAVVRGEHGDLLGRVEHLPLRSVLEEVAVEVEQPLRNRAAAALELVLARVAVTLDKVPLADEA